MLLTFLLALETAPVLIKPKEPATCVLYSLSEDGQTLTITSDPDCMDA